MRNIIRPLIIALSLGFFLASCSGFKQMEIDKRHYRNGFYVHHAGNVNTDAAISETSTPIDETALVAPVTNSEQNGPAVNNAALPQVKSATVSYVASPVTTPIVHHADLKNASDSKDKSISHPETQPALPLIIHHSREKESSDDMLIIEIILCFLIPCVAVLIHEGGINDRFWISLLLMLLLWVPGIIYALLVCLDAI